MEKSSGRLRVFALVVLGMFVALTVRLWFLQVLAVADFRREAKDQGVRVVATDAARGTIYDRNGREVVRNQPSYEVRVIKDQLEASPKAERTIVRLSELLDMTIEDIRAEIDSNQFFDYQPKPIAEFVPEEVYWAISERPKRYPGVEVVQTNAREYPYRRMAAHVLGWVDQINDVEYAELKDEGYGLTDIVGKAGLERVYERYLRGKKGLDRYLVNADGEILRQLASRPPTEGADLQLALDARIQQIAERELYKGIQRTRSIFDEDTDKYFKADSGAVVVLDPDTGGVVAMASWPDFDPRWFLTNLTPERNNYLFNPDSVLKPILNRATQFALQPGSTFKPFVALSAVKEGIASLDGYYPCPAEYVVPGDESGTSFSNWSPVDIPPLRIADLLRISCDTSFYAWGNEFWNLWSADAFGTGNEPFQRDLRQWSFGRPTGVDLPGETGGLVPDAGWKERYVQEHPELFLPQERTWLPGDNILLSIGSGNMLSSPLQLATAYAALGNGGRVCRPHVVDRITDDAGHTMKKVGGRCAQLPYTQAQLDEIRGALATVPVSGTAQGAFYGFPLSEYPVAGKTGTAVRGGTFQDTSWFAGLVPADDPEYVVVAMVEEGGFGSDSAAPIVRHVIEGIYGIEPTAEPITGSSD
jgi:penicillin-binding protein 2